MCALKIASALHDLSSLESLFHSLQKFLLDYVTLWCRIPLLLGYQGTEAVIQLQEQCVVLSSLIPFLSCQQSIYRNKKKVIIVEWMREAMSWKAHLERLIISNLSSVNHFRHWQQSLFHVLFTSVNFCFEFPLILKVA